MQQKRIYGTWWQAVLIFGLPLGFLLVTYDLRTALSIAAIGLLGGAIGWIIVFFVARMKYGTTGKYK